LIQRQGSEAYFLLLKPEELHELYRLRSNVQIGKKKVMLARTCSTEIRNIKHRILAGQPLGRQSLKDMKGQE
jgi:hypothetical protein